MITHFQSIQGLSNTTALSGDLQLHLWVQHRSPPGAHKGSLVGALPACSARQGPLLLAGRSWLRCQLYLAGRLMRLSKGQSLRTTELTCKGGTDKPTRSTPQAGMWASQPLLRAPRTQKQVEAGTSVSDALPLPHFPGSPGSS